MAPAWDWISEAFFLEDEVMDAEAMRKGTREVVGLAVGSRTKSVLRCLDPREGKGGTR